MDVRVLLLDPPPELLAERSRLGLDVRDELWDGVIHVVPAPMMRHQDLEALLLRILLDIGDDAGLDVRNEVGLYRPGADEWRVPDMVVFDRADASARGIEGCAKSVVEVRSPGDESWEKIPFYLEVGVGEVVIIDRDTLEVSVVRQLGDDAAPVVADDTMIRSLGVTLTRVADDHIRLTWRQDGPDGGSDGEADVRL